MSFTLTNKGTSLLVVRTIESDNETFTVAHDSLSIESGKSEAITLLFVPLTTGPHSSVITIMSNDLDEQTVTVNAQGTGVTPDITVSVESIEFGNILAEHSDSKSFTVSNDGTSVLVVNRITSDNNAFTVAPDSVSVEPGGSETITVTFSPLTPGGLNAAITMSTNDLDEESVFVSLSGAGITPEITVSPVSIDFGDVEVSSSDSKSFTIANDGTSDLEVSSVLSSNDVIIISPASASIKPGNAQSVTVTFSPVTTGPHNAVITLSSNDIDEETVEVGITGVGVTPDIDVSPVSLDIGNVNVGSSQSGNVTLTNNGTSDLIVSGISSSNDAFTITPSSASISPGESKTITVIFTPVIKGDQNTLIKITSNDLDDATLTYEAAGTGASPEITVFPVSLNLGEVFVGSSVSKDFTIVNEGTSDLVAGTIVSDNSAFTVTPESALIKPGNSATVTVTFSPDAKGSQASVITVSSNDPGDVSSVVNVAGTATLPEITVSSTKLNFGDVEIGSSNSQNIIITSEEKDNTVSIEISNDNDRFTAKPSMVSLEPGASETVAVTYTPDETGDDNTVISMISNNIRENAIEVNTTGAGIAPRITLSTGSIDFGDVELGDSDTIPVTLTNDGDVEQVETTITIDTTIFTVSPASVELGAGESRTVTFSFIPGSTGDHDATITLTSNGIKKGAVSFQAHGTGTASLIAVFPEMVAIGNVEVGSSGSRSFSIANKGSLEHVVCNFSSDNTAFVITPESVTLEPGETKTIILTFNPVDTGSRNAVITITKNTLDGIKLSVNAGGKGVAPRITVSQTALHFGDVEIGSRGQRSLTIKNEGSVDRVVCSISSNSSLFTAVPSTFTVGKGENQTVELTYIPLRAESHDAVITVTAGGLEDAAATVSADGRGVAPDITLAPLSLDFGDVSTGNSVSGNFVIKNDGTSELVISDIVSDKADFTASVSSTSLAPGTTRTVTVTFSPAATGARNGAIQVMSNDPEDGIITVNVQGSGFHHSSINLSSPSGEQTSDVIVNYAIIDPEKREVRLAVEYLVEGGQLWNTATVKEDLTAVKEYNGSFTWSGKTDIPGYEGNVRLAVTPNNDQIVGVQDTVEVYVNYNIPPSLTVVPLSGEYSGEMPLRFDVIDAEGDTVYVSLEYSLDEGGTYLPASVPDMKIPQPGKNIVITWDTRKDLGYVYNQEALLRLKASDKYPGEQAVAGPFIVTNLIGDYNNNREIDAGDLLLFAEAWKTGDITKEIGPASGEEPPRLVIDTDGIIDFEDLMVFARMWQWWTEESAEPAGPAKNIAVNLALWDGLYLVSEKSGVCAVMCKDDVIPDFLDLRIQTNTGNSNGIIVEGGEYWQRDGNGIVLTRHYEEGPLELAAVKLGNTGALLNISPHTVAQFTLASSNCIHLKELTIDFTVRLQGESELYSGTISVPVEELIQKPAEFAVFQNTPNPFNPSTTIEYALPEDSYVTLSIYNVTGQRVTVLKNEHEPAGIHSVTWDAGSLPSGMYFYTITTGNQSVTKKMLLMK